MGVASLRACRCREKSSAPKVTLKLDVKTGVAASLSWASESANRFACGGVAERTIATVLKTVEVQASGGSNPPPSASSALAATKFV